MFRKIISPSSSGSKSKPSKKRAEAEGKLGFLGGSLFDPKDGVNSSGV
jgi:hypothetical protein